MARSVTMQVTPHFSASLLYVIGRECPFESKPTSSLLYVISRENPSELWFCPHKGFQDVMTIKHDQVIRTLLTLNISSPIENDIYSANGSISNYAGPSNTHITDTQYGSTHAPQRFEEYNVYKALSSTSPISNIDWGLNPPHHYSMSLAEKILPSYGFAPTKVFRT
ncbi:hypothetical protein DEO72_LG2g4112 [Vigna unguiculata]|uniref:Uncharacterized protein n=1 Tax=Vigna unguiculata TaxID=3917 RepID=A0A4D6L5P0_VIGUN|nr:hypothetical protein DEO72_LG2g4112 [Vigna unguiculata]